jgi:hypothetical protein
VTELSLEQKGRRAKEILEDDVFLEVIERVRLDVITQWTLTEPGDLATRENLYMQNRGLDELIRGLRTLIGDWTIDQARQKNTKQGRSR